MGKLEIIKRPETLSSDDKRVITRFLGMGKPGRVQGVITRIAKIPPDRVEAQLARIVEEFHNHVPVNLPQHQLKEKMS